MLYNLSVWCLCVVAHGCRPDSGVGTIYVSDDRGAVFSKSLERHLYTTTGSETDFTAITSLRGVYMTSVLTEGEITHTYTLTQWADITLRMDSDCFATKTEVKSSRWHKLEWYCAVSLCVPSWKCKCSIFTGFADGVVETVVTFDQGAKWQTLRTPQSSQCDSETSTNRPKRVRNTHTSFRFFPFMSLWLFMA